MVVDLWIEVVVEMVMFVIWNVIMVAEVHSAVLWCVMHMYHVGVTVPVCSACI